MLPPIALLKSICGGDLRGIVDSVVISHGAEVNGPTLAKLLNYLQLLASTGISDDRLVTFGSAYLKEILEPDPRYTGC
jgi:hypothetical protein